jgi:hypothetical protein
MASSISQAQCLAISRRMFEREPLARDLIGRITFWHEDAARDFGFIQTAGDEERSSERFLCYGSSFYQQCGVYSIVKFDVWKNNKTGNVTAINVRAHKPGFEVIAANEIGTLVRWFPQDGPNKGKGSIKTASGDIFQCSGDNFDEQCISRGDLVRFDIRRDNWNGTERAINICRRHSAEDHIDDASTVASESCQPASVCTRPKLLDLRKAQDGNLYSRDGFLAHYGPWLGERRWKEAHP